MTAPNDLRWALRSLIHQHRRETREQIQERWRVLVKENPELIQAAADFYFSFAYNKILKEMNGDKPKRRETKINTILRTWDQGVEDIKWTIITNLLDFETPLGKVLGECTGAECIDLGGFFKRVGKAVPADDMVANHLNNKEILNLFLNRRGGDGDNDEAHPN